MISYAVLGLGSNKGNRLNNIRKAVKEICLIDEFNFIAVSSVYKTEPWGYKNQTDFLNCVLVCLCRLKPDAVLNKLKSIELKLGRIKREKWHQREIDIDILFFGSNTFRKGNLIIPHPQIQNRNFVLKPLLELMPDFIHPVLKKSVKKIYLSSPDNSKAEFYSSL